KWIFPRLQLWMSDPCLYEVHFADAAGVVLEGSDLLGVRRPDDHGPITLSPTRIVGGVTVILNAIRRELLFLAACGVSDPEVVIPDKDCALSVRRCDCWGIVSSGSSLCTAPASRLVTRPAAIRRVKADLRPVGRKIEGLKGQRSRFVCRAGG